MQKKTAERELKAMMNVYDIFTYKFRDRGYMSCPHCHRTIMSCPFCRTDMLLEKAASYPDYLATGDPIFIEVKWGKDRYNFDDISEIQRHSLTHNENSWVFLIIGDGRAPKGRGAWLVPWDVYQHTELVCLGNRYKSILFEKTDRSRVPEADDHWRLFRMDWYEGGWRIPLDHIWWLTNNTIGIPETDLEQIHGEQNTKETQV